VSGVSDDSATAQAVPLCRKAGTWPFGVVEAIWAVIALRRYRAGSPVSRFAASS
jgi:hypothetical protein